MLNKRLRALHQLVDNQLVVPMSRPQWLNAELFLLHPASPAGPIIIERRFTRRQCLQGAGLAPLSRAENDAAGNRHDQYSLKHRLSRKHNFKEQYCALGHARGQQLGQKAPRLQIHSTSCSAEQRS